MSALVVPVGRRGPLGLPFRKVTRRRMLRKGSTGSTPPHSGDPLTSLSSVRGRTDPPLRPFPVEGAGWACPRHPAPLPGMCVTKGAGSVSGQKGFAQTEQGGDTQRRNMAVLTRGEPRATLTRFAFTR